MVYQIALHSYIMKHETWLYKSKHNISSSLLVIKINYTVILHIFNIYPL